MSCRSFAAAALVAAFLAPCAQAQAACDLRIKNLQRVQFGGHAGNGYEVFERDQHAEAFEVTIERVTGACPFVVGFSAGGGGSYAQRRLRSGAEVLAYQLYKTASATDALKDVPVANENAVFTGVLSADRARATFQAVFLIPFLQVVPPGSYQDSVMVKVYEGTLQSAQLRDQAQLNLSARVPATAEFCLGEQQIFEAGYRNACVDFGALRPGAVRTLRLHARSNSGYRITVRSQNGGVMRILDPGDASEIPYTLAVDGITIPLATKRALTAMQASGLTSAIGDAHHFKFTISDVGTASAGEYRDVIEVTLFSSR